MIHIYAANDSNVLTEITQYLNLWTDRVLSVTQNAEEQANATSSIVLEDALGALNLVGLRDFVIEEDSATFKRIWRGQIGDRKITRGPYRAGSAARIWTSELNDLNTRLDWRVGEGNVSRPAETDVQRMQYLLTTLYVTDIVGDVTTYFSNANPVAMDAADYAGQYISDYVNDCLQAATAFSKNCYLLDVSDGSGGYKIAIWYGPSTLTTFSSAIKISNILADVDNSTVFAPYLDGELARSPSRVYSGVHVNYDGGFRYRTRGATASVFFATRDTVYDAVNVKTSGKADARGDTYLDTIDTEDDVITCTIQVPASHVNDVRAGMRIQVKFSHFTTAAADYSSDYVWFRVLNRTVTLIEPQNPTGAPGLYEIALTLSPTTNTPPAAACSVIGGNLSTGATDGGVVTGNTSDWTTIPNPSAYPAVVLVGAFYVNGGTDIGGPPLTVDSPFTLSDGYASAAYDHSITAVAYHALTSGAPGTYRANWAGGGGSSAWNGLAIALPTAATAPVQIASQLGSGDTVNFASPLTVGNIVLLCQTQEVGGTPDPGSPPWTLIISKGFSAPFTVGTQSVAWYYTCVTEAGTSLGIGDPSFAHFSFASEWALT